GGREVDLLDGAGDARAAGIGVGDGVADQRQRGDGVLLRGRLRARGGDVGLLLQGRESRQLREVLRRVARVERVLVLELDHHQLQERVLVEPRAALGGGGRGGAAGRGRGRAASRGA